MNKPNRKFTPKQDGGERSSFGGERSSFGGERSERPRRPRNNEGSRAAGFSDKRYSPMLDPDDNKVWQQRDEAGRRYRPSQEEGERPRRPRSEEGPRFSNRRRDDNNRSDFKKPGREGYEGESRAGNKRPGSFSKRTEGPGRGGDAGERNFKRRDFNNSDGGERRPGYGGRQERPQGGEKPQWSNKPRPRSTEQDADLGGGYKGRREEGGYRPSNRSEGSGPRREGGYRGGEGRPDFRPARSEEGSGERRFNKTDERRSTSGRRGESRYNDAREGGFSKPEGRFTKPEGRGNSGRRGESRFESPRPVAGRGRSRNEDDFEAREHTPFKKKDLTERKSATTATPPTYDFSQIKPKESKAAPGEAQIRLNKYIADSGICSRRDADELIASGQVAVNGEVVTQMGHKVKRSDAVTLNGKKINPEKLVYVLLNKPKDFITTTDDPQERRTVMQLVDDAAEQRIYPVGRLDRNTTGLLLLTNDGDLAEKLSHPSHKVKKVYQVLLDKPLVEEDLEKIQQGIVLEDGPAPVDEIGYVVPDKTVVGVEIHIGRNRIVRRIFEHLGYEVLGLDRVIYAGLTKKDLTRGHWRYLSQKEVIRLKHFS